MKKVTAFIGSYRKQSTYNAVKEIEKNLKKHGEVVFEYVFLKDYTLDYCRGCKLCLDKGEEFCPLKDDRDLLIEKLKISDGVIFATPNYSFQVTASMKNLMDRLAFIFHRPRYFEKTFMPIVTQGAFGGGAILKYLNNMGENFGFQVVKGCCLNTLEPMTEIRQKNINQQIEKASARFYKRLIYSKMPAPSFFRLLMFRMTRTSVMEIVDRKYKDYQYFREKGWFSSVYYYDVYLNPIKKIVGRLFDLLARMTSKYR